MLLLIDWHNGGQSAAICDQCVQQCAQAYVPYCQSCAASLCEKGFHWPLVPVSQTMDGSKKQQ